ncbi:Ubiquitin-conjugating enzyme E2 [Sphaerulina musiva]
MATKRIIRELEAYNRDPSPVLSRLEPISDDNLLELTATLLGPEGTAYEGGKWNLHINLPTTYPSHPPTIRFTTPICHPNIKFPTGEICLDLLSDNWTPAAYGIVKTLEAVQYMLDWEAGAEPTSPLNVDVARLMREGDWVGVEGLVRFYTWLYAGGRG